MSSYLILFLILAVISLLIRQRFYKAPIDWDTSYHLYQAKMWAIRSPVKSSYTFGIKIFPIILYYLFYPLWKNNHYRFRILTLASFLISLLIFVFNIPELNSFSIFISFGFVVCLNTIVLYPQTSATEFYSFPLILLMLFIPKWGYALGLFDVLLNKVTNLVFVLIYIPFEWQKYTLISLLFGIVLLYSSRKFEFEYKTKIFFRANLYWNLVVILPIIIGFNLEYSITYTLVLAHFFVMLIQRKAAYFYWYIVQGLFFVLAIQTKYPFLYVIAISGLLLNFLFKEIRYSIRFKNGKDYDYFFRQAFVKDASYKSVIEGNEKNALLISENIKPTDRVYLWGTNVQLLLLANLVHCGKTFYNHHHLVKWSKIKNYITYINQVLLEQKPEFIIVSIPTSEIPFDVSQIPTQYKLFIEGINQLKVYKRI